MLLGEGERRLKVKKKSRNLKCPIQKYINLRYDLIMFDLVLKCVIIMTQISNNLKKIKDISVSNCELLEDAIKIIKKKIKGRREIMYSDIINFIIRGGYMEERYSQLILWCNYKIRLGKTFVEFD